MKVFESKWVGHDGTPFFLQGWEPEHTSKATVALLHGLGEHTGRYAHVGNALTDAGYALIGFDLRGHGKSGGGRGHFPSLPAAMQDIKEFVGFLTQRYPDLPQFLYGHSLGGLLALSFAIQHGGVFRGVIVTGAGLRSPLEEQKAKVILVKVLGSFFPRLTLASGLDHAGLSRDQKIENAYLNDPLVHDRASLGFGRSALRAIDLCFARARELVPPLLIMHGTADRIAYLSGSEEFARLVSQAGGDVTLKLWDGFYHEIHNEAENTEVFKTMIDWLDKHLNESVPRIKNP